MSSTLPLQLALVGCPHDTRVYHDVATRLQGGRFTVVVDRDAALARAAAETIGATIVVDSFTSALEKHGTQFDAVVIGGPLRGRATAVCHAAHAGKHVLVESPVAESLPEAESAIDACQRSGVCFTVGQTLRLLPDSQAIMDRLSSGKLGEPGLLRVHRWRAALGDSRPSFAESLFGDIDLAVWLFGARPTEVYALGRKRVAVTDGDDVAQDYVQLHFGFPSGGMALFDFSDALPAGEGYESLSLIGSCGAAYADDHHNTHLLYRGGNPAALFSQQGHLHMVHEHQAFVDAIVGDTQPPVTGEDCLVVHQVMDAVRQSLRSAQVLRQQGIGYEPVHEK